MGSVRSGMFAPEGLRERENRSITEGPKERGETEFSWNFRETVGIEREGREV